VQHSNETEIKVQSLSQTNGLHLSLECLAALIKNPQLWGIGISTKNIRDIRFEIVARVDGLASVHENQNRLSDDSVRPEHLRLLSRRVDDLMKQAFSELDNRK
jgi:hypothetical protein